MSLEKLRKDMFLPDFAQNYNVHGKIGFARFSPGFEFTIILLTNICLLRVV
jgi:hypothetical protein